MAAHQAADGGRIEGVLEQDEVVGVGVAAFEPAGEASDRDVGQTIKLIKDDAKMRGHFPFVVRFQLGLIGRKHGAYRIVHQMQRQPRVPPVPERIQLLKGSNTFVKDPLTPLRGHVFRLVTRHGGNQLDFMLR